MKIAFATSSFRGGGITSYAFEFIKAFKDEHEISVLIGDDSKEPIEYENVKVYKCESADLSVENAQSALHLISDVISPDILFISNSRIVSLIIPYIPDNIRVITIGHSQKYIEADLAAFQASYLDSIVALSTYSEKYISKRFHLRNLEKCVVLPNFVHSINGVPELIGKKINSDKLQILFMGGSSGSKSPDIVFKIMAELKKTSLDFIFYWLGNDEPPMKRFLSFKHVSDLFKDDARFVFTGRIPRNDALAMCERTNVILMPSRREGCPMALLEAMRSGVITVTSDYDTACKDMVIQGKTGVIIKHNDIKQFVDVIADLVNNRSKYDDYYKASYELFESQYSYEVWRQRMNSLFSDDKRFHKKRYSSFSKKRFAIDKARLKYLDKRNYFVQLVEETLYPSLAFFRTKVK